MCDGEERVAQLLRLLSEAGPCKELAQRLREAGYPEEVVTFYAGEAENESIGLLLDDAIPQSKGVFFPEAGDLLALGKQYPGLLVRPLGWMVIAEVSLTKDVYCIDSKTHQVYIVDHDLSGGVISGITPESLKVHSVLVAETFDQFVALFRAGRLSDFYHAYYGDGLLSFEQCLEDLESIKEERVWRLKAHQVWALEEGCKRLSLTPVAVVNVKYVSGSRYEKLCSGICGETLEGMPYVRAGKGRSHIEYYCLSCMLHIFRKDGSQDRPAVTGTHWDPSVPGPFITAQSRVFSQAHRHVENFLGHEVTVAETQNVLQELTGLIEQNLIVGCWLGKKDALSAIRRLFKEMSAGDMIRVATGFFTVSGYQLLADAIGDRYVRLLVGVQEPSREPASRMITDEIMADLRTRTDVSLTDAVRGLVKKLEDREIRIVDARSIALHAKTHIGGTHGFYIGSSNISRRGLSEAVEGGIVIRAIGPYSQGKVDALIADFDHLFNRAENITGALLDVLKKWLEFCAPWDIYLKTILSIRIPDGAQFVRPTYRAPNEYQTDAAAHITRTLIEMGGAMLVASMGLGKTVISADIARRLRDAGRVMNVLVIGPGGVQRDWRDHLAPVGLTPDYFTLAVLDQNRDADVGQIAQLERLLNILDDQWLLIIDEVHAFRNRYKRTLAGRRFMTLERLAHRRISSAVERSKCKVLTLTGTPYATDIENINGQLFLLPDRPSRMLEGEEDSDEYIDKETGRRPWRIRNIDGLRTLPVATVITTPYVAAHYGMYHDDGQADNGHISVAFGERRRYIPRMSLYRVDAPPVLQDEMIRSLEGGHFKTRSRYALYRASIEIRVRVAWGSSPLALREVIERAIIPTGKPGAYNVEYENEGLEERETALRDILNKLHALTYQDDQKFMQLCFLLDELCLHGGKVVIFVETYATAFYLHRGLKELRPHLRPACTVIPKTRPTPDERYSILPYNKALDILDRFAVIANRGKERPIENQYNILITTDAYGVGVNLQDAHAVISYDLAWTPITPAQRAGRILRFQDNPVDAKLYIFVPHLDRPTEDLQRETELFVQRFQTLVARHGTATGIMELPTITAKSNETVDMIGQSRRPAGISFMGHLDPALEELEVDVSPIFEHTGILKDNRAYAEQIPDDITSARTYSGTSPALYLLIRCQGKHYYVFYDIEKDRLLPTPPDVILLDILQCDRETPPIRHVTIDQIDEMASRCLARWRERLEVKDTEIQRVCTLYLEPWAWLGPEARQRDGLADLLLRSAPLSREGDIRIEEVADLSRMPWYSKGVAPTGRDCAPVLKKNRLLVWNGDVEDCRASGALVHIQSTICRIGDIVGVRVKAEIISGYLSDDDHRPDNYRKGGCDSIHYYHLVKKGGGLFWKKTTARSPDVKAIKRKMEGQLKSDGAHD